MNDLRTAMYVQNITDDQYRQRILLNWGTNGRLMAKRHLINLMRRRALYYPFFQMVRDF